MSYAVFSSLLELKQLKIEVCSLNQELSIVKEDSEAKLKAAEDQYKQQLDHLQCQLTRTMAAGSDLTSGMSTSMLTSGVGTMTEELEGHNTERPLSELDTEIIEYQAQLERTMESYQLELTRTDELETEVKDLRVSFF